MSILKNHYVVALIHGFIWVAPLLLTAFPHVADLSVSAVLSLVIASLSKVA